MRQCQNSCVPRVTNVAAPSLDCCRSQDAYSSRLIRGGAIDQRVVIAQLNIEHFRKLLEQEVAKRLTLLRLLAEEQAKLASLNDTSGKQKA